MGVVFRKDPSGLRVGFQGVGSRVSKSHRMHRRDPSSVSEQGLRGKALGFLGSSRVLGWGIRRVAG